MCRGGRAGWTGCTPGWRRRGPRSTRRWSGAVPSPWKWPPAACSTRRRACSSPGPRMTRGRRASARSGGDEALAELEAAAHQVFLARKFYNDAVAATRASRRRWLVRLLRLAGGAPWPEFFEIDESLVDEDSTRLGTDMPHLTTSDPPSAQAG